jgi:hypothetical protein
MGSGKNGHKGTDLSGNSQAWRSSFSIVALMGMLTAAGFNTVVLGVDVLLGHIAFV